MRGCCIAYTPCPDGKTIRQHADAVIGFIQVKDLCRSDETTSCQVCVRAFTSYDRSTKPIQTVKANIFFLSVTGCDPPRSVYVLLDIIMVGSIQYEDTFLDSRSVDVLYTLS